MLESGARNLPSEVASAQAALRWALAAYLAPHEVQAAAALWRPSAAGASNMAGLSRYCRELARQFNLQGREAEIHLDIIRAMQAQQVEVDKAARARQQHQQHQDSVPDGWSASSAWVPSEPGALPSLPGELPLSGARTDSARLVQAVVERMSEAAQRLAGTRVGPAHWCEAVVAGFRQARLKGHAATLAQAWLHGRSGGLAGEWPARGDGTRLINAAYVALAQFLGPVQADACLTRLVRDFEQGGDPVLRDIRRYL